MFDFSGPSAASARCTSARARCTAGSAAAAGPDAAEVAQRRLDRRLRRVDRVDQLATRRCRSASSMTRASSSIASCSSRRARCSRGSAARSSRLAPVPWSARRRWRGAGSAGRRRWCPAAIWSGPGRRLAEPVVERVGAGRALARGRGSGAPVANSSRSSPRSSRFSWRPPEAIWRVRLRSTCGAVEQRRRARAPPRCPARARPAAGSASARRSRASVVIGPLVWKSTSNGVAQPAPRSRWKASKLLRDASSGGRFCDVRRPGVERQRGRRQQQQRERREQHRDHRLARHALGQPHPRVLAARRPQLPAVHVRAEHREAGGDREQRGQPRPARRRRSRRASRTRAASRAR